MSNNHHWLRDIEWKMFKVVYLNEQGEEEIFWARNETLEQCKASSNMLYGEDNIISITAS